MVNYCIKLILCLKKKWVLYYLADFSEPKRKENEWKPKEEEEIGDNRYIEQKVKSGTIKWMKPFNEQNNISLK